MAALSLRIGGGAGNVIQTNASYATIPGGHYNLAGGEFSLAAGRAAHADHRGAFVWADAAGDVFSSTRNDEFAVRAAGGFWLASLCGLRLDSGNGPLISRGWDLFDATAPWEKQGHGRSGLFMEPYTLVAGIPAEDVGARWFQVAKFATNGTRTALMTVDQAGNVSATAFNPTSDRNAKENFAPVNPQEVLAKVTALPISTWNFKSERTTRHLGPVAQDFHAAFGLGQDDKHIATVDADGVALTAIQGLHDLVKRQQAELQAKTVLITELGQRLEKLEQLMRERQPGSR